MIAPPTKATAGRINTANAASGRTWKKARIRRSGSDRPEAGSNHHWTEVARPDVVVPGTAPMRLPPVTAVPMTAITELATIKQADPQAFSELISEYGVSRDIDRAALQFAGMGFSARDFELITDLAKAVAYPIEQPNGDEFPLVAAI